MVQENVEVLRAGFDAFNRGDYDSWVGAFAEDAEVHDLADTPDTGVFYGHAGIREWLAKLHVAFGDGFRFEPTSFTESRGLVVADVRASATGVGGGVPIEMSVYIVFHMREGKIVWTRTQGFLDREAAMEAEERLRESGAGRRRGFGWVPRSVSGLRRRSSRPH
jgi:ketosteroid isomerase-like protein